MEVVDLCVRYSPELPYILKNVTFCVRPGEKIGVVGRTGHMDADAPSTLSAP